MARPSRGGYGSPPPSTLADILDNPAFAGFAARMLPWDGLTYDRRMPLAEIGSLLPYHTHVEPDVVVAALNRMIDDVDAGRPVFYDIYTEEQKRAQPAKANAGLFFFRGRPGAPFALIAPGGGFAYVGSLHEGFPYAQAITERGYNAFVVKYRAGQGGAVATEDMAAALSFILGNAGSLQVDSRGYSLWGQFRRSAHGGLHRVPRRGRLRRRRRCTACGRRHGLHRPFRPLRRRAPDFRDRRRPRRHRPALGNEKTR